MLEAEGYHIMREAGVGFVTPITLLRDFAAILVSPRVATRLEALDRVFPRLCHLYLVEARPVTKRSDVI